MSAIENFDAPTTELDADIDAFMGMFTPPDADKPSGSEEADETKKKKPAPEAEDDAEATAEKPEADEEAEGSEKEAETDDKEQEEKAYADDGAYVKIKVGEEEHEVPVKDLGRLYGQEKALTQKSMEVATLRKQSENEVTRNLAAYNKLLERAAKRYEPYSKVDFLLAAKELSAEDYTNLRQAALSAYEDVQFYQSGLKELTDTVSKEQHDELVKKAGEAIKTLSGPVDQGGIEGWDQHLYNDVRSYAITSGLDQQIVDNLVDPAAIRIIHSAMLYERGKSKVVTTKVNKTPKKVVKTTRAPETGNAGKDKSKANNAMRKLRETGSQDDAAEAFLAMWETSDE